MGPHRQTLGIVLLCDNEGNVVQVIRDELGLADRAFPGRPVSLVVDRGDLSKALNFLVELQERGAVLDWELNVPVAGQVTTLHVAGVAADDQMLIVGAKTSDDLVRLFDELIKSGDAGLGTPGAALRECRARAVRDGVFYEELSRLNNELTNLQRELAKKIAELERLNAQVQGYATELEQRVAERTLELQSNEAKFRAMFEGAGIGIALTDTTGHIIESNPALQEILGFSAEELRGKAFAELGHPDDSALDSEPCTELIVGENECIRTEQRYRRKDKRSIWANLTVSLIHGAEGEPEFAIYMVEDVTEQRKTQTALLRAEKLAVAGKLAASLAHEINNPMQTVIGCLGLAQEALEEGEDAGELLQVALEELRRATRVVADLRDLHRPPSPEERELTDVDALLEQVLTLSRKKCEQHRVEVTWSTAPGLPLVPMVPDRLKQVFLNLVLNAVDAMLGGGRLEVSAAMTRQPAGVRVTFADTGEGIPPDVLPRIFEPFYSGKADGLGLGLFISDDIVRRHEGHIDVESKEGQGTTFAVWLPA